MKHPHVVLEIDCDCDNGRRPDPLAYTANEKRSKTVPCRTCDGSTRIRRTVPLELFVAAVRRSDEMDVAKVLLDHAGSCSICGKSVHEEDDSYVTWRCGVCRKFVCRHCALTVTGRHPTEYYETTLCSLPCWEKAGRPAE